METVNRRITAMAMSTLPRYANGGLVKSYTPKYTVTPDGITHDDLKGNEYAGVSSFAGAGRGKVNPAPAIAGYSKGGAIRKMANGGLVGANGQELEQDNYTGRITKPGGGFASSSDLTFAQNQYETKRLEHENEQAYGDTSGRGGILARFAKGGAIKGKGGPTSDDVPIMASNGEYMIKAKAVKKIGIAALDHLNAIADKPGEKEPQAEKKAEGFQRGGAVRKMATGGFLDDPLSSGDRLRAGAQRSTEELQRRLAPSAPPSAGPGRSIPLGQSIPTSAAVNPNTLYVEPGGTVRPAINPQVGAANPSPERLAFEAERAVRPAPLAAGAPEATAAPRVAPAGEGLYGRATQAASQAAQPMVPQGSGAIARMAGGALSSVGNAALGLAKKAVPWIEPGIEAARVARVAMDPATSGLDVATQGAEGVGRGASTIAGAGIGGAAGAALGGPFAPVTGAIGSIAGGALGYFGGDRAIKGLRSAVGLDSASPVEGTDARSAMQNQPAATPSRPAAAAPVQPATLAAPSPTAAPSAIAALARPPVPQRGARRSPIAAAATMAAPVSAAAAPTDVQQQIDALHAEQIADVGAGSRVENGMPMIYLAESSKDPEWRARYDARIEKLNQLSGTLPKNPNGVLRIDPGNQWSVGGVAMPESIVRGGQESQYMAAANKGAQRMADPIQAKIDMELAGIQAQGQNQRDIAGIQAGATLGSAGIHAGSAANVAGIQEKASNYRADKVADAENWAVSPAKLDPMTGQQVSPAFMYNKKTGEPKEMSGAAPPKVSTKAEFDKLAKGATYTGADGKTYRK